MADAIWNNNYILSNMDAQKLYAQSPLTTGVSGTSAWIGIEPSALSNETVLYSSETGTHDFTATEPLTNFEEIKFVVNSWSSGPVVAETFVPMHGNNTADLNLMYTDKYNGTFKMITFWQHYNNTNMTTFTADTGWWYGCNSNGNLSTGSWVNGTYVYKVVGINRKENA